MNKYSAAIQWFLGFLEYGVQGLPSAWNVPDGSLVIIDHLQDKGFISYTIMNELNNGRAIVTINIFDKVAIKGSAHDIIKTINELEKL
jgi:hypothetical protein